MSLETIQKRIEQLEKAQEQMRIIKVTLDDALKEDDKFQEIDAQLRDLTMQKKRVRDEVLSQQTYQEVMAKLKDIKEEIADTTDILNHELLEWRQTHNTEEIIGSDGTTRKLKVSIRLQPLRNK